MKHKIFGYVFIILVASAIVAGIYHWQNLQQQPVFVPVQKDETASWKTYTSDNYNFELKYPPSWTVQAAHDDAYDAESLSFQAPDTSGVDLFVDADVKDKNLAEYMKAADEISKTAYEGQPSKEIVSSQNIMVAGQPAVRRVENLLAAGFTTISTYVMNGGNVYWLWLRVSGLEPNLKYTVEEQKNYDRVISSFKFVDVVFCGGLAGTPCPTSGYICESEGDFPDAGTYCKKD